MKSLQKLCEVKHLSVQGALEFPLQDESLKRIVVNRKCCSIN